MKSADKKNMKTLLIFLSVLFLSACGKTEWSECDFPASTVQAVKRDARPVILVIGDSISLGYTPVLQSGLSAYNVVHSPCNPPTVVDVNEHIDNWLNLDARYAAVVFNSGLHDLTYRYNTSDSTYEASLRSIAQHIKAKNFNAMFNLSTEVLAGTPAFDANRVVNLNVIASDVMNQAGIPVFDLYSVSQTIPNEHKSPTDVHYTGQGYKVLGDAIKAELFSLFGIN